VGEKDGKKQKEREEGGWGDREGKGVGGVVRKTWYWVWGRGDEERGGGGVEGERRGDVVWKRRSGEGGGVVGDRKREGGIGVGKGSGGEEEEGRKGRAEYSNCILDWKGVRGKAIGESATFCKSNQAHGFQVKGEGCLGAPQKPQKKKKKKTRHRGGESGNAEEEVGNARLHGSSEAVSFDSWSVE